MLAPIAAALLSVQAAIPSDIRVLDAFGRDVTQRGITLLDWEGQIANPAIKLSLQLPKSLTFPAQVYLSGTSSRIHFDRSDSEDRTGIGKRITLLAAKSPEFHIAIFPDRDAMDEAHELLIQVFAGGKEVARQMMPVAIIDQDQPSANGGYPLHLDFSEDRTGFTSRNEVSAVLKQAASDWAYFMLDNGQDTVPVGAESTPIWNPDGFVTQRPHVNTRAYNGYMMYICGAS